MSTVLLQVLEMSAYGSVLLLLVMLFRMPLKKAPKSVTLAAWAIAAVRLVCPFALTSVCSLMPALDRTQQTGTQVLTLTLPDDTVVFSTVQPRTEVLTVLAVLWCAGVAVMLLYTLCAYTRTRQTLREAVKLEHDVYECDRIPTPFIFGLFRPGIYLPSAMDKHDRIYVIAHERAHLTRFDHLWKPLGFAVLAVHWFNPLVWLGYVLFCRDMEMACDERVLTMLGADSKKPYADALINCAAPTRRIAACPLAFGETDVKARVQKVLSYQKPAVWATAVAVAMCLLLALCFLTDPTVQALSVQDPTPPPVTTQTTAPTRPTVVQIEPSLLQYTQSMAIEAITPRAVAAGESVSVRVRVQDTRGLQSGVELLLFCEQEDEFVTVGEAVTLTLCEGTAENGVYEGVLLVPATTPTGEYRLRATYRPVSEKPAFCTAYTPEGEAAVTVI